MILQEFDDKFIITKEQLKVIERSLDKLFSDLGIDIEFTKHFLDRLNDERNQTPITPFELAKVYKSLHDTWGEQLVIQGKSNKEIEELVKSINTMINIPIVIGYDKKTKMITMTAKTIMRKKDFKTPSPVLQVESFKEYLDLLLNEKSIKINIDHIINDIEVLKNKIVDNNLSSIDVVEILNNNLKNYFIQFEFDDDYNQTEDYRETGIIGGGIDENLNITIFVDSEEFWKTFDENEVSISLESSWDYFINVCKKIISHEMIHRKQFKNINNLSNKSSIKYDKYGNIDELYYLSNKHELMAKAHNIILELKSKNYLLNDIKQILSQPYKNRNSNESDTLREYMEHFDSGDKVIKSLLKYAYDYLD